MDYITTTSKAGIKKQVIAVIAKHYDSNSARDILTAVTMTGEVKQFVASAFRKVADKTIAHNAKIHASL